MPSYFWVRGYCLTYFDGVTSIHKKFTEYLMNGHCKTFRLVMLRFLVKAAKMGRGGIQSMKKP